MHRLAVLLALAACSQSRPSSDERGDERGPAQPPARPTAPPAPQPAVAPQQPPAVAPQPAPPRPPAPDDLMQQLQELGKRRVAELRAATARADDEIPALGPCQRPSADERAALRERVLAWIEHTTAGFEHPAGEPGQLSLRFGCVEPAGIVIAAQMDRETRQRTRSHAPDVGHWWTLRARPGAITALSETRGLATMRYNAYVWKQFQDTLALADLDGDGALDPLVARTRRKGLTFNVSTQLSVIDSRTNRPAAIATLPDEVELSRAQGGPRGPIVLEIVDHRSGARTFRCVGASRSLAHCAEAEAGRRRADALAAAERLAALVELPDRDQLADWLDLLDTPRDVAAPLLAAAPPPTPAERAAREIERIVRRAPAAARQQKAAALAVLATATRQALSDPVKRAKILRALEQFGAPRALLDDVSRLP